MSYSFASDVVCGRSFRWPCDVAKKNNKQHFHPHGLRIFSCTWRVGDGDVAWQFQRCWFARPSGGRQWFSPGSEIRACCSVSTSRPQYFHLSDKFAFFAIYRNRYDKGLIAIQSLAVFRLLDQRERYESLRGVLDSGPPFVIPHFDDCLPGVSLCHVPVVNHTCGLILKLNSLDGVVGVRSAAILAEFEARETSR